MNKLAAISITLTFAATSCISLSDDTGSNTFVKQRADAKQHKKALLFLKEAALSSNSYQVTVCDNNHTLDKAEAGNTFTVDANHDSTFLDTSSINFTWFGSDTLQIDYDKKLRTFIQQTKVDGITIVYKPR